MKDLFRSMEYLEKFVKVEEYGRCLDATFKEALADVVEAADKYNKIKEALNDKGDIK